MSDWFESLEGVLAQLWQRLEQGVADRSAPARHVTFATINGEGWPEARTVVLRAAIRDRAVLEVHTDIFSAKVASLSVRPCAELHVWDSETKLQTRARCTVASSRRPPR